MEIATRERGSKKERRVGVHIRTNKWTPQKKKERGKKRREVKRRKENIFFTLIING